MKFADHFLFRKFQKFSCFAIIFVCCINLSKSSRCPGDDKIWPCLCTTDSPDGPLSSPDDIISITCTGPNVTQLTLNQLFGSLRSINNISWDSCPDLDPSSSFEGRLYLKKFTLDETWMTHLDLGPFLGSQIDEFYLDYNLKLNQISVPAVNEEQTGQPQAGKKTCASNFFGGLDINRLFIYNNNLAEDSLAQFFKLLSTSLTELYIKWANMKGLQGSAGENQGGDHLEFIKGLSYLTELDSLDLQNNGITRIGGGQFKNNNKLSWLDLGNNKISQLGAAAFEFEDQVSPDSEFVGLAMEINLSNNELNDFFNSESNSAPINLLGKNQNGTNLKVQRPIKLYLDQNNLITLPRNHFFENYLKTDDRHKLYFDGNPFQCNSTMKWIKDLRPELEHRVLGVKCQNDPGQNVFTSSLA